MSNGVELELSWWKHMFILSHGWCLSLFRPFIELSSKNSNLKLLMCNFSNAVEKYEISGSFVDDVVCVHFEWSLPCFEVVPVSGYFCLDQLLSCLKGQTVKSSVTEFECKP